MDMEHAPPSAAVERPELRAQRAVIAARQAELELARRGRQPDFEAMAGYNSMWDTPEHRWMVGLGLDHALDALAQLGAHAIPLVLILIS